MNTLHLGPMVFRCPLLCGLILVAGGAQAQAPHALNAAIPTARAARLLDPVLDAAGGAEPDTTSAWRYFPLHVGDAWEWYDYFNDNVLRRVVTSDTTFNGRLYFRAASYRADVGGPMALEYTQLLRFDALTAFVMEPFTDGSGQEVVATEALCPLDAPFDSVASCWPFVDVWATSGGYDGRVVFGGEWPGTGEDTVVTSYKQYAFKENVYVFRHAADFGVVYRDGKGVAEALYFARVDGVAHGVERYPGVGEVAAEPRPTPGTALVLAVRPSPARSWAVVAFSLAEAGPARVDVYEALGRRVRALDLGHLAAGPREVPLDLAGLPAGVYVARLTTGERAASQSFVVLD